MKEKTDPHKRKAGRKQMSAYQKQTKDYFNQYIIDEKIVLVDNQENMQDKIIHNIIKHLKIYFRF